MATSVQSPALLWVNSRDGRKPGNPSLRTAIRRQAMSNAAAERKRRGNWGQGGLRQHLVYTSVKTDDESDYKAVEPQENSACTDQSHDASSNPIKAVVKRPANSGVACGSTQPPKGPRMAACIPASPSSTGYEAMRIRYDFDVLDLSALTALHIGRTTAEPLHDRPSCLTEILQHRQWSYFSYMPWRFGHTQCLDDALRCVAARTRQWLVAPGTPNNRVLALYTTAVKSLQAALNDPVQWMQPDVLCATEVLSIFQLLDTERWDSWLLHAAGAATLIRLRGPERYETNFEKALFLAQAGPIITEATFNALPCFLEEPAWQRLFQNVFLGKSIFSSYSDVFVRMWACISAIPGLTRDTVSAIHNEETVPHATQEQLRSRIFDVRSRLMQLGVDENLAPIVACGQLRCSRLMIQLADSELQHDILGVLAINLIRLERLLISLGISSAVSLEAHVQELANQVLDIEAAAVAVNPRASLSLSYKVMLAKATMLTAGEWQEEISHRIPRNAIEEKAFDRWIGLTCPWRVNLEFSKEHRRPVHHPQGSGLAEICLADP
ncbi:MAG: hypothetical protein Q9170_003751 [Blastenia crenularia]